MENKTLISYVPKKSAAVIPLSTEHNVDKISGDECDFKADIILHYNNRNGTVDTTEKLTKGFTTSKR